jgi:hypothetical protein
VKACDDGIASLALVVFMSVCINKTVMVAPRVALPAPRGTLG